MHGLVENRFSNSIDEEQRELFSKHCNALRETVSLPQDVDNVEDSRLGKLYAFLMVSLELATRVNTMVNEMTLHELITGRAPLDSDKSFFATTIVEPLPNGKSLRAAPEAFCFPGAAFRSTDKAESSEDKARLIPPVRIELRGTYAVFSAAT